MKSKVNKKTIKGKVLNKNELNLKLDKVNKIINNTSFKSKDINKNISLKLQKVYWLSMKGLLEQAIAQPELKMTDNLIKEQCKFFLKVAYMKVPPKKVKPCKMRLEFEKGVLFKNISGQDLMFDDVMVSYRVNTVPDENKIQEYIKSIKEEYGKSVTRDDLDFPTIRVGKDKTPIKRRLAVNEVRFLKETDHVKAMVHNKKLKKLTKLDIFLHKLFKK